MIHNTLNHIKGELLAHFGEQNSSNFVQLSHAHTIKDGDNDRSLRITLINIEEEKTLKNLPAHVRINGMLKKKQPPVFINLYLLFTADFNSNNNRGRYENSLEYLSDTMAFFQSKPLFTPLNTISTVAFPQDVEKISMELHNLSLEELNHLWGIHGSVYYPSVLYKCRLVKIEKEEEGKDGPEIKEIQVETGRL